MMSAMTAALLARSPLLVLPLIALVLFVAVFTAVCWRTLRADRADHARASALPFDGDDRG